MKISEFKQYIKETIVDVLSEEKGTVTTENPDTAKKLANQGVNVNLATEDIDDDTPEPTAKDISKKDSVSTLSRKLQDTTKEMKTVLNQWKKAEGTEKENLLARLKKLTKIKKELEGLL